SARKYVGVQHTIFSREPTLKQARSEPANKNWPAAGSGAGAYAIACAIHNGGQIEPVGRPLAGTVLRESGRAAL
ncbi:hypothetical protein, partial [Pseudarthrobacter cellobiosi]|uniref:hypothetical protein n=1 Tax=Pseudarthrobacter cellobiosi TaxID=2953654 RepID=UPI00208F9973